MSLVEATIILMTLAILTGVLAPTIGDYVNDARQVKVKEDVEVLGTAILRLLRDLGKPFPQITVNTTYTSANRVDLLVTEGNTPSSTAQGTPAVLAAAGYPVTTILDWDDAIGGNVESATDHLVTNVTGYATVVFPTPGGPSPGLGWRGGYISVDTGPDPWGTRYGCATVWMNPGSDALTTNKGTNKDAFCMSAGSDAVAETDMDGNGSGVVVGGDDFIFIIQGSTR
jgi:type II secretory pathway pseudopilin PulG